jgi:hypothetical protein
MNEPSEQDIDESPTASSDSADGRSSNRKPFKKNLRVAIPQQKNFSAPITRLPISSNTQQVCVILYYSADANCKIPTPSSTSSASSVSSQMPPEKHPTPLAVPESLTNISTPSSGLFYPIPLTPQMGMGMGMDTPMNLGSTPSSASG